MLAVISQKLAERHDVTILSIDTATDMSMYGYDRSKVKFDYITYGHPHLAEYYACKFCSLLYKKVLPHGRWSSRLYSRSFFLPSYKRRLVAKINGGGYDVVVGVHAFLSLHLASVRDLLQVPRVIGWMHNSYEALFEKEHPYLPGLKWFFSDEMRRMDSIVVLSHRDEKAFRERLRLDNLRVIYNPLTLEPKGAGAFSYRKFLSVGRFTAGHKGFDLLIKAFAAFARSDSGWTLEIVGEGPEEASYRQLIADHHLEDRVRLCPFTTDIQRHYSHASVYVLSSRWEGQPLVLLEAMSHGLPVISSDIPVAKELLEGNGASLLFPVGDIPRMSEAMRRMAMLDEAAWAEMSGKARQYASRFSLDDIIREWEDVVWAFHQ